MSLLLSGRPGSGKTSMCRVVEHYLRAQVSNSDTFVVAVYLSFRNEKETQGLQAVLAFIVETMLKQRPQIQKYYNRLMLTREGPLEVEDSLRIIHRARQDFRDFYILIDALDECDTQQAQVIVERLTRLRHPLKVLATSRQSPRMTAHFSTRINMESLNSYGIRRYIERSLAAKLPVVSSDTGDAAKLGRIAENLLRRSEGQYVLTWKLSSAETPY
jgi:adenylate kinase family enzyme